MPAAVARAVRGALHAREPETVVAGARRLVRLAADAPADAGDAPPPFSAREREATRAVAEAAELAPEPESAMRFALLRLGGEGDPEDGLAPILMASAQAPGDGEEEKEQPESAPAGQPGSPDEAAEDLEDAVDQDEAEDIDAALARRFLDRIDGEIGEDDRRQADRLATVVGRRLIGASSDDVPDEVLAEAASQLGYDADKILLMRDIVEGRGDKGALESRIDDLYGKERLGLTERSTYLNALRDGKDAATRSDVLSLDTRRALTTPTPQIEREREGISMLGAVGVGRGRSLVRPKGKSGPEPKAPTRSQSGAHSEHGSHLPDDVTGGVSERRKGLPPEGMTRHPTPNTEKIIGFENIKPAKRKTVVPSTKRKRPRWKDDKRRIYEWDSKSGTLEVFDKRGKHLGEFDPTTGKSTKAPVKGRRVEP